MNELPIEEYAPIDHPLVPSVPEENLPVQSSKRKILVMTTIIMAVIGGLFGWLASIWYANMQTSIVTAPVISEQTVTPTQNPLATISASWKKYDMVSVENVKAQAFTIYQPNDWEMNVQTEKAGEATVLMMKNALIDLDIHQQMATFSACIYPDGVKGTMPSIEFAGYTEIEKSKSIIWRVSEKPLFGILNKSFVVCENNGVGNTYTTKTSIGSIGYTVKKNDKNEYDKTAISIANLILTNLELK